MKDLKKDDFLYFAEMRITNTLESTSISNSMEKIGYASEQIEVGKNLLREATQTHLLWTKHKTAVALAYQKKETKRS